MCIFGPTVQITRVVVLIECTGHKPYAYYSTYIHMLYPAQELRFLRFMRLLVDL